ncbi:ATP-binding protein [Vibrio hannami]|uniref:HAMP domain-containing sensor histidine kinase n=1 Tax=Vibrio hannami TaxID=2717094 RepID=UPI00241007AE|nr:ATP-binding protein [Vibrio hannami]MDG3084704.1 ATP-binding protein [Vibrio hannami]
MNFKLWPQSLAARTSLLLLLVILAAQFMSGVFWYQHTSARDQQGLVTTAQSLARSASSTISFFKTLPTEYRHLVLNQLRNIGGTRFFVSLNNHELPLDALPDSNRKQLVVSEVKSILHSELGTELNIKVDFTRREKLKVFNNELKIDELPLLWAHYSLSYGDINPPILVIQIEVADDEWFYLAAVLPAPYVNLETTYFEVKEWVSIILSAILLMICTWYIVRGEIRPVRQLAKAATMMTSKLKVPEVKEEGSAELRAAVRAFNKMNRRINSHIHDREMLFGSISHDLKTPIASLKLRAEMLENPTERENFFRIINELDLMVKGSLQCIKETDIHEEIEGIDLMAVIEQCRNAYGKHSSNISIFGQFEKTFAGKPLAIKRCVQNLIDNGIKYGTEVDVDLVETEDAFIISISDYGDGVDDSLLDKLFEPYFRLSPQHNTEGNGLGLTISRSIAKAHGGKLTLQRAKTGGLCATLELPRE